jgi:hypothetical protein
MDDLINKLKGLNSRELDYVMARSSHNTIKDACDEIELSTGTFYHWDNKDELEDLAKALRLDRHVEVELKLRDALPDAVQVVIEGLKERRYDTKFKAAVEILDRTMGKATQKIDQNVNASGEIIVTLRKNDAQSDD